MYIPKPFEETSIAAMHALISAHPLATLVTHSSGHLDANHLPLFLSVSPSPHGCLQGHIARANPLFGEIAEGMDALAIFKGPDTYISPSWYATKATTGKVVPTWNYVVVHAYGVLRVVDNAEYLRAHLDTLTIHHESRLPAPWALSDAPSEHIEKLMTSIVGVELTLTKLLGKWKVSQNQSAANQHSLIAALQESDLHDAQAMAALVSDRAKTTSE